jgi:hypothetical protein
MIINLFILVTISIIIVLLDFPQLVQAKANKKILVAYCILLFSGLILGALLLLDRAPQSPLLLLHRLLNYFLGI